MDGRGSTAALIERTINAKARGDPRALATAILEALGRAGLEVRPKSRARKPVAARLDELREQVSAVADNFSFAMACHEAWKPATFDVALHARLSHSYAGNTFILVRRVLRREMLLALMRIWDTEERAVRITFVVKALDERIIDILAAESAARFGDWQGTKEAMNAELSGQAAAAAAIAEKYEENGSGFATLQQLRTLRHKRLAHHDPVASEVGAPDADDKGLDAFYQDTAELVRLLLHVVAKTGHRLSEEADVYRRYAEHFWAGVRSEKMEGHPDYRPPLIKLPGAN